MNLIALLVFLTLVVQFGIAMMLKKVLKKLKTTDLSREDAIVRAMTKNVEEAKDRIPPP